MNSFHVDSACIDQSCCGQRGPNRNHQRGKFVRWRPVETPCLPASATNQLQRCQRAVWRPQRRALQCELLLSRVCSCASLFAFLQPRMAGVAAKTNRSRSQAERAALPQRESRAGLLRLGGSVDQPPAILRRERCDSRSRDGLPRCACTRLYAHVENPFLPVAARKAAKHDGLSHSR